MNILHGTAAAALFQKAFEIPEEEILIFNDVLSYGALKTYTDIKSWKTFREKSWHTLDPYAQRVFHEIARDFYTNFDDFKSADSYHLWLGTGLGDQLLLAFIIHLIIYHELDIQKLSIYQFETIKRKHFNIEAWGIALLHAEEIKNHPAPTH